MNTNTWKVAGLAMAIMGSLTLVQAEPGGNGGEDKGSKGKGGKQGHRPSKEQMLENFDTDADGQLSEDERTAMRESSDKKRGEKQGKRPSREEILEKFDANDDGELSEEERAVVRETMGNRGGGRGKGNRKEMMEKFKV